KSAKTVVWNGPAGVFEMEPFSHGTRGIMKACIEATAKHGTVTVVGGGDSATAAVKYGLSGFSHVSTGGGASLAVLEGHVLPGIARLSDKE
ncbi:Phosphoglycerate kinase like protein, partial [Aduncisulcus paluster]